MAIEYNLRYNFKKIDVDMQEIVFNPKSDSDAEVVIDCDYNKLFVIFILK